MKKDSINKETLSRVLRCLKPYRGRIALSLVCAFVTVVLTLVAPILSGRAIDGIVAAGNVDFPAVVRILILFFVTVCVTSVTQWVMNQINNAVTYRTVRDIR